MPHVDISMLPGRNRAIKQNLALKVQSLIAQELKVDPAVISVSIEDVSLEAWDEHMRKFAEDSIFVHAQE